MTEGCISILPEKTTNRQCCVWCANCMGLRTRANVQLPFASKGCPSARLAEALTNGERTAGGGRARSSRASAPPSTSSKPHHRGPIAPTPAPSGRAKTSSSQRWLLPVPFSLFLLESRGARLEPLSAFYRHAWEPGPNFKLHSFNRTWPLTRRQEDTPQVRPTPLKVGLPPSPPSMGLKLLSVSACSLGTDQAPDVHCSAALFAAHFLAALQLLSSVAASSVSSPPPLLHSFAS